MVCLFSCNDKKEANNDNTTAISNESSNTILADEPGTPVAVSCDESLTALIKNSGFKSPFKDDITAAIESRDGNTLKIQLTVKSDGGANPENTVGWLLINTDSKKIMDITNDIQNPVNITYDLQQWNIFINCNKQKKNTNMVNTANIEFGDLFNEGTVIRFTPAQLNDSDSQIAEFKARLKAFENKYPASANFNPENLTALINNEVFANSDFYVDSSWLNYFIKRYDVDVMALPQLFETAVTQEDYNAVKVLISNGYIVSYKQIQLAKTIRTASDNNKLRNKNNKGLDEQGDPVFYVDKNSKIIQIEALLEQEYKTNTVSDKDGFVNVRKEKNASSQIVDKINNNEKVEILDNTGKWWPARTKNGKEGYIFADKIK